MKYYFSFLITLLSCINLMAQTTDFVLAKQLINTERRVLVTEVMELTEDEAKIFWPIYDEYELERSKMSDKRQAVIERYAKYYNEMSDDMADKIVTDMLSLNSEEISTQKKYYKRFSKALSNRTAARFMQLDDYLTKVIRIQVASQIPFIPNK